MAIVKSKLLKQLSKNWPNFLRKDLEKFTDIILKEIKKFTDANLEIGDEFKEKIDKLPFPQIFYDDRFAFEAAIIVRDAKFFDARFTYHNERHALGLEEEKLSKSKYSKEFLLGNSFKRIRAKVSEDDFAVISGLDGIEIV